MLCCVPSCHAVQVGMGSISALSTAGAVSKFGVPLLECRQQLVDAFVRHPWLDALHLHVGSQVGAWLARLPGCSTNCLNVCAALLATRGCMLIADTYMAATSLPS